MINKLIKLKKNKKKTLGPCEALCQAGRWRGIADT
jgi:hypothetical protein